MPQLSTEGFGRVPNCMTQGKDPVYGDKIAIERNKRAHITYFTYYKEEYEYKNTQVGFPNLGVFVVAGTTYTCTKLNHNPEIF